MQRRNLHPEMLRCGGGDVTLREVCQASGQRVFPGVSFPSRRSSWDSQGLTDYRQGATL